MAITQSHKETWSRYQTWQLVHAAGSLEFSLAQVQVVKDGKNESDQGCARIRQLREMLEQMIDVYAGARGEGTFPVARALS